LFVYLFKVNILVFIHYTAHHHADKVNKLSYNDDTIKWINDDMNEYTDISRTLTAKQCMTIVYQYHVNYEVMTLTASVHRRALNVTSLRSVQFVLWS